MKQPGFEQLDRSLSDSIPFIVEGQVIDISDPDQMGRVKIWIPSVDGETINVDILPWANYASPLFGFTVQYPHGSGSSSNESDSAYGFWAIPKIGATVYVFFLNANPDVRCYFASSTRLHRNRSLPAGRNTDPNEKIGPWGDSGDGKGNLKPLQPAFDNLRIQFQNRLNEPQAKTRGLYERQVAQAKTDKDGLEGYSNGAKDKSSLEPQTYSWTTPGGHALIFQDDPTFARVRLKTADGNQIILDDANERIYVSTAHGKSWIEMDKDGHIHIYGAASISARAGKDFNIAADGNVNIEAFGSLNLKAGGNVNSSSGAGTNLTAVGALSASSCEDVNISAEKKVLATAATDVHILANQTMRLTGRSGADFSGGTYINTSAAVIHFNGPQANSAVPAQCAATATGPSIIPAHEPWGRPDSEDTRGPNWNP